MTPIVAPMAAAIKLVCSCEPLILFAERAAAFDQEYSRWSFCKTVNLNDALPNVTILRPAVVYHVPIVDPFIARDGTTVDLARSLGVSFSRRCQSSGGKVRLKPPDPLALDVEGRRGDYLDATCYFFRDSVNVQWWWHTYVYRPKGDRDKPFSRRARL